MAKNKKANFTTVSESTINSSIQTHYDSIWGNPTSDLEHQDTLNKNTDVDSGGGSGSGSTVNDSTKEPVLVVEKVVEVAKQNAIQKWLNDNLGLDIPVWGIYAIAILIILILIKK